jgi:hypothetical protein
MPVMGAIKRKFGNEDTKLKDTMVTPKRFKKVVALTAK